MRTNPAAPRVRLTERWFNTLDTTSPTPVLLVNLPRREAVRGATDGELLALTDSFYDGLLSASYGVAATGNLTLVRQHADPINQNRASDTAYAYDGYGNRTQVTTYAGYATSAFAPAGGGSAA
ncbi:MAG: hypothetical protein ACTHMP_01580, partial [Thermomicrobiales bacterium]